MMKYFLLFLLILNFVSFVGADCLDNQININSASLEELENISGIGPVYAGRIIEERVFASLEELIKVKGIGEKTLEKIKLQGLACVEDENVPIDKKFEEKIKTPKEIKSIDENLKTNIILIPKEKNIILNSAVEDSEKIVYESKNSKILKWIPYAFSVFLIFIILILFFDK